MGIKNWTITADGTKSAFAREIYLHDKKHPNHKNTEGYLDVFGSDNTTLNIIHNAERHKLETARKRKGGRPPLEATEFVMTFPKGIRPTQNQWLQMLSHVMTDVADNIGVKRKELQPILRAVAHQQDQNPKKGSGDHMHIMIGRFTNDGKYLRALQSKSTLYRMKQSFNVAALRVMGVNHATYEPVKAYKGVAKRRVPKWKADAGKAWDTIKKQHNKNMILKEQLTNLSAQVDSEFEGNKQLKASIVKFFNQADKWLEAFEIEDLKQMNRQRNRINKTVDELGAFAISDHHQAAIDMMVEKINTQENKANQGNQRVSPTSGFNFK